MKQTIARRFALLLSLISLAPVLLWCRNAAAADGPVVVRLEQDSPAIDAAALRDAVARELDAPVVAEVEPGSNGLRMTVRIDHAQSTLTVERRAVIGGTIERRVPLPSDPDEVLRTAVFLIGNLARDEASELLQELRPQPAPPLPPAAEPASDVLSPAPAAVPVPAARRRPLWVGASFEGDVAFLPGDSSACQASPSYSCVAYRGDPVWDVPRSPTPQGIGLSSPGVVGGANSANTRLVVAVDYAVDDHVLLGGRIGYVTATYPAEPKTLGHLHLEARATYLFGTRPLATTGFFPVLALGVGAAEYSSSVTVTATVNENGSTRTGYATAWRVAGPGFVSAGLGVRWSPWPAFALSALPLKGTLAFGGYGSTAVLLSPEVTAQFGF